MNKEQRRYLTIEEVISLPSISNIQVSNDGKNLAFVKKTVDWGDNKNRSRIWIYEKGKEEGYPLTAEKTESTRPKWSPDGERLAYLSPVGEKDDEKKQIFIKPVGGYVGTQVTNVEEGVSKLKWSPDGEGFFFISTDEEQEEIKKRKEVYGDFEHVDQEYRRNRLYYIDLRDGIDKLKEETVIPGDTTEKDDNGDESEKDSADVQLTTGKELHIVNFDIAPDGKTAVLIAVPSPNMEDYLQADIYMLDIDSKDIKKLNMKELLGYSIYFSPDGSKICYTRSIREKEYYKNRISDSILEIFDLETEERVQPLADFSGNITPLAWNEDGILVQWQDKTNFRVGVLKNGGNLVIFDEKDGFTWECSTSKDGQHKAYIKAKPEETFEIYFDGRKITDINNAFAGKLKSKKEVISWKSSDGLEIEGVLSVPCGFDENREYPLLVVIHGGPTWASFPIQGINKRYPIEQFVEKGFVVLEPNYRGSSGYGNEFLKANYKKLGIGDYDDVISGVDMLIEKDFVDPEKVGVMGWSQGGYISAFCSTYSDRFKAISVGAGISNWITYYANTDIHQFTRMYLGDNPWNDKDIYEKTSPMTYIQNACTPTLIQHGEKDGRVPTPNAYELYQGLRDVGVETELIIYKGMGHGPNKPGINRAIMKQNLLWFSHHILGESLAGFRTL